MFFVKEREMILMPELNLKGCAVMFAALEVWCSFDGRCKCSYGLVGTLNALSNIPMIPPSRADILGVLGC